MGQILDETIWIECSSGYGRIRIYQDDKSKFVVAISAQGQRSPYPKVFKDFDIAMKYAKWVAQNWSYHLKMTDIIKTTPLTYK